MWQERAREEERVRQEQMWQSAPRGCQIAAVVVGSFVIVALVVIFALSLIL
jgi:hypothetical protein